MDDSGMCLAFSFWAKLVKCQRLGQQFKLKNHKSINFFIRNRPCRFLVKFSDKIARSVIAITLLHKLTIKARHRPELFFVSGVNTAYFLLLVPAAYSEKYSSKKNSNIYLILSS